VSVTEEEGLRFFSLFFFVLRVKEVCVEG
jgi:hypothetical protein